jgi:hypothetical protein
MEQICKDVQDQIPQLVAGTLSQEKASELQHHISQCPLCSEYWQALLADDERLSKFAEMMQPKIHRLEEVIVSKLKRTASSKAVEKNSTWSIILKSQAVKLAAAAVFLIAVGYITGRLSAPRQPDLEQLQPDLEALLISSLEPAIRQDVLEHVDRRMDSVFATKCGQFKDELHLQVRRDLTEFASQTLAATSTVTNRRLAELIQLIEAARMRDRQRIAEALEQIELRRLEDRAQLGSGLGMLAEQTSELLPSVQN